MPESTDLPTSSADAELRGLLRRVRRIELKTRRAVNSYAQGAYHSRFKGRGMAFSESRAYVDGDDPRHVDWNVTARTGELFVKQFVEERELTLLLAVDLSGSLAFGSIGRQKRQLAAEAAALLAFSALRNHDKVGLLLFADQTERLIMPQKGRSHVLRILREILATTPRRQKTDLPSAVRKITHLSNKRAIVALITDLQHPDATGAPTEQTDHFAGLDAPMRVLAKRHDVMLIEIEDPLEHELPDVGLLCVRDAETGREALIDTSRTDVREAFAGRMRQEREQLRTRMTRLGVERVTLSTAQDASLALIRFLQRRAKRAR